MFRGIENQIDAEVLPLLSAVLCVDCESVTNSRGDECPVCGSRSLLSLARTLGGTLAAYHVDRTKETPNALLFDLGIMISLEQMEARDLNAAVECITSLIGTRLGRGKASLHINVEPVTVGDAAYELKTA